MGKSIEPELFMDTTNMFLLAKEDNVYCARCKKKLDEGEAVQFSPEVKWNIICQDCKNNPNNHIIPVGMESTIYYRLTVKYGGHHDARGKV